MGPLRDSLSRQAVGWRVQGRSLEQERKAGGEGGHVEFKVGQLEAGDFSSCFLSGEVDQGPGPTFRSLAPPAAGSLGIVKQIAWWGPGPG